MSLDIISILTYAFLFFLFLFYTLKYNILSNNRNAVAIGRVAKRLVFILIIFAGLRYKTGTDFESYMGIWSGIKPIYFFFNNDFGYASLEPGFLFFTSLLRTISTSEILFLLSMSSISIIPVYLGLKKINILYVIPGLFFYLLVFYIPYIFNGMRQAVAMGIFVYTLPYILDDKKKKIILLTLLAISFHTSGIIILISYLIYKIKINLSFFLVGGVSLTVLLSKYVSVQLVFEKLGLNIYYLEELSKSTSVFQILTRIIVLLFLLLFYRLFVQNSSYNIVYKNLFKAYFLGFFIYVYFFELNTFATRINMFFRVLEVILFPIILISTKRLMNKVIVYITFLFLGTYIFISSLSNSDNDYHFFFQY
jgi:hypothetical protein